MILNNKQEQAIKTIVERFNAGERYSVLAGYAGTGKSTCVKFIVEALSSRGVDQLIQEKHAKSWLRKVIIQ